MIDDIRASLEANGFVFVDRLFGREDANEVATEVARMERRLLPVLANGKLHPFARGILRDDRVENGGLDQVEILYPGCAEPALRETRLFARCAGLARAIAGRYSLSFDSAVIKLANGTSTVRWHRDADYSLLKARDRPFAYTRLHFWIPLQATCGQNGALEYVAGSHREPALRFDEAIRNPSDPGLANRIDPSRHYVCNLEPGSVAIHTSFTLHGSGPNRTGSARAAWILTFSRFGAAKLIAKRMIGHVPAPGAFR